MENEQNKDKDPKGDPKNQARNLFLQTGLTQAQIAQLIGVSQKSVSLWMNEGKWRQMKKAAEQAPAVLIEQMTEELSEIHYNIAAREPGQRFATGQEAEIRRKIMMSIKYLKEQQTTGAHIEVLMNFMAYVRRENAEDAKTIMKHADTYLTEEKHMGIKKPFESYLLPGTTAIPTPAGVPDPNATSPEQEDTPDDLNKAA